MEIPATVPEHAHRERCFETRLGRGLALFEAKDHLAALRDFAADLMDEVALDVAGIFNRMQPEGKGGEQALAWAERMAPGVIRERARVKILLDLWRYEKAARAGEEARASTDGAAWEGVDRQEIPGLPASLLPGLVACGKDSGALDIAHCRCRRRSTRVRRIRRSTRWIAARFRRARSRNARRARPRLARARA